MNSIRIHLNTVRAYQKGEIKWPSRVELSRVELSRVEESKSTSESSESVEESTPFD